MTNDRQKAIAELIGKHAIASQEELIALLKSEYKIESTQTAVSRDLKDMGCIKAIYGNKRVYALPQQDTRKEILRLAIKGIQYNETQIALHTGMGLAPFVGDFIDQQELDIIGCIAGENVVFVAPSSIKNIAKVVAALKALIGDGHV